MKKTLIIATSVLIAPLVFTPVNASDKAVIIDENSPAIVEGRARFYKLSDGDTAYISVPMRFYGYDCHETRHNERAEFQAKEENITLEQVYEKGKNEKEAVEKYIKENIKENGDYTVWYTIRGVDKYGRLLGDISFEKDGETLNHYVRKNNICPAYKPRT